MQKKDIQKTHIQTETRDYFGYTVCKDGTILSLRNKPLKPYSFTYENSHVNITIDGKQMKKTRAHIVYNAFADEPLDVRRYVLRFKDGDSNNVSFDNLIPVRRKEYYKSIGMNGKSRITEERKEEIRKLYKENPISIRDLCKIYECSLHTMQKIIRGKDYSRRKTVDGKTQ